MKKTYVLSIIAIFSLGVLIFLKLNGKTEDKLTKKSKPNDMFSFQRSYPSDTLDLKAINKAYKIAKQLDNQKTTHSVNGEWILEGPTNIGGRLNAIEVDPNNSNIIYTGSAAGGIFKTTNGGSSWLPIADELAYLAISDITIDPTNSNIIYAASGDHNISGTPHIGNGVYKSTDGGVTWTHKGLSNECIISRVVIDPANSNTIYAAAMGKPFVRNNDRGLYKSTDGGNTWNQVLLLSTETGVIDVVMDPFNSNTLYCAGWDRIRTNQESMTSGNGGRIYKSTDGGANWTMLTNGLPSYPVSRIGLAISQQTPDLVFAVVVDSNHELDGIYKTTNGGNNWSTLGVTGLDTYYMSNFGWYFGQIRVSPYNDNEISLLGVEMQSTTDGGANWFRSVPNWWNYTVHADDHDLVYIDSTTVLLATDGGLFKSSNSMGTWSDADEIPNSQFYRVAVDPHNSGRYAGGAQDNGTTAGNSISLNSWPRLFGGDGFTVVFDPFDPNLWYFETQNGDMYFDDGSGASSFNAGIGGSDRRNWDMPFIMSSHSNSTFYTGTYQVYQNTSAPYGVWNALSGDLTDGVIYGDMFHTISTVDESPINADYLYAGTTDGNVWRSTDQGFTWDSIMSGLPNRYVTDVKASPTNQNTVYVVHSGYKYDDNSPHIHKSNNKGDSWIDISGDLPPFAINDIAIQPNKGDSVIYVATDGGVYATVSAGTKWHRVGDMPYIPIFDLAIDEVNDKLIAGTFSRSIQSFPIDSVLAVNDNPTVPGAISADLENVKIYPNPTSDYINVVSDTKVDVKLFDLNGNIIYSELKTSNEQIDVKSLPSGVYFISLDNKETRQIIKQ